MIRRTTLVVLGVFILLLAGTFIWQKYTENSKKSEATPTASTSSLFSFDEAQIDTIALQDNLNRLVKLQQGADGTWELLYPHSDVADAEAIKTAIHQLMSVSINSIPQGIPDLEAVGLDQPSYTVMIVRKDGTQYLMNVGDVTPTETGYYVLTPERVIYIASKYNLETFLGLLDNPPIIQTPTPSMEIPQILEFPTATSTP